MPCLRPSTRRVHVLWRSARLFVVPLYPPGACGFVAHDLSVLVNPYQDLDAAVYPRASFVVYGSFDASVGVQRCWRGLPLLQGLELL